MKIALITGGSRGLGRNSSLKLAARGVSIILTYNSKKDEANEVVKEIESKGGKAWALQLNTGDVKSFPAFKKEVEKVLGSNKLDYLVNNAGIGSYGAFAETTEEQFDTLMNIHFKGVFFLTQALLPLMNDGGKILNVSTGLTRFALPGYSAYAAMKGAVEVLTRYMARELGARKITVNVIAPGAIATDFGGGRVRDNKELNDFVASNTALGRVGLPDDIGDAVANLLSDEAHWMTAQRVEFSGGQFL